MAYWGAWIGAILYSESNIVKFTGSSGSTFFVDSYGIHKAEVPTKKQKRFV